MAKAKKVHHRAGMAATRAVILAAAKVRFVEQAYENVGIRDIARDARVDPALIGRYFGSKQGLYKEVMREFLSARVLTLGDRANFGARVALSLFEGDAQHLDLGPIFFIIRACTSPHALPILQEISHERFTQPFAEWLGGERAELRAQLIAATMFGAALSHLMNKDIISSASARADYAAELRGLLQAYVDGRAPWRESPSGTAKEPKARPAAKRAAIQDQGQNLRRTAARGAKR
ncbi:MAG: TetR family transcriptional regulator [Steroidobacteraceae bacterium]